MSAPTSTPAPPAARRRRWLLLAGLGLLLLVPVGVYLYATVAADLDLRAAVAETERGDPRWRLADLEADRAAVPDEENGAIPAARAAALMPGGWPAWDVKGDYDLMNSFGALEPMERLREYQLTAVRAEMKRAAAALVEARKLKDYPTGRCPGYYAADFLSTRYQYAQDVRSVVHLLQYDVLLRAEEGDADGALDSCRAILNAGRSVGDESTLVPQMVRMALRAIAVTQARRALGQGEPSEAALRPFQELLEREAEEPLLLRATRGDRAGLDQFLDMLQTGKTGLTARGVVTNPPGSLAGPGPGPGPGPSGLLETMALSSPTVVTSQRAALLRYMNRLVEAARLPPEQQVARFQELEAERNDGPVLVRVLAPPMTRFAEADRRTRAQLLCTAVAVAAERYRRDKGRWPDGPEALAAAGYLRAVPADPYDGQPLRWRRLDDGVVVYSVGPDGQDHGGAMDFHTPLAAGTNLGFRLWDVSARRQPTP